MTFARMKLKEIDRDVLLGVLKLNTNAGQSYRNSVKIIIHPLVCSCIVAEGMVITVYVQIKMTQYKINKWQYHF